MSAWKSIIHLVGRVFACKLEEAQKFNARVQLGHYAENHGEHYICVDGRVLSSEEGQEERIEEKVECNLSADGGELLSTQEDDTDAQYKENE